MNMSTLSANEVQSSGSTNGAAATLIIAGRHISDSFRKTLRLPRMNLSEYSTFLRGLRSGYFVSRKGTAVKLSFSDSHIITDTTVSVTACKVIKSPDVECRLLKISYAATAKNAAGISAARLKILVHIRAEMLLRTLPFSVRTSVSGVSGEFFSLHISQSR